MRRGITLLEMLVAAILLAVGLLGALEVVARCAATSREAEDRARGLMFARSKMDEILKEPVLQTGTDQGRGIDETTDYDWEAAIEPSSNPSLVMVTVLVINRKTGTRVPPLTVLRRPDLQTPPETAATGTETTTDDTDLDAGGGGV